MVSINRRIFYLIPKTLWMLYDADGPDNRLKTNCSGQVTHGRAAMIQKGMIQHKSAELLESAFNCLQGCLLYHQDPGDRKGPCDAAGQMSIIRVNGHFLSVVFCMPVTIAFIIPIQGLTASN